MDGPVSKFQVGDTLSTAFTVWIRNLIPYGILNVVVHLPLFLYVWFAISGDFNVESLRTMLLVLTFGGIALDMIATGAVTYGVVMQLRGTPASIGTCLTVGIARLFPILAVGIVVALTFLVGLVLLIIPGFIFFCMFWVAVPVAVVEKVGVGGAMTRSKFLTAGSKVTIFVLLIVVGILSFVANKILVMALPSPQDISESRNSMLIALFVGSFFMGSFQAVINAVGYHYLRASREGTSVEDLAKVFD